MCRGAADDAELGLETGQLGGQVERTGRVEGLPRLGRADGVVAEQGVDEALEVRRLRHVHRRRRRDVGVRFAAGRVHAGAEELVQHVVLVGREHELADRHAHRLGVEAREDVAEVSGRHRERDLEAGAFGLGQAVGVAQPRPHVVNDLGRDAAEVDRVHRAQAVRVLELQVGVQLLHQVLAVVERALDGDVVDVVVLQRVHLRALERAHASLRRQHEHRDAVAAAQRVLGGGSGVARRRADDVDHAILAREGVFHGLAEELHRHVLERQRRTLGQADERDAVDVGQRNDVVRGELAAAVRAGGEACEVFGRDVGREAPEHRRGEGRVVQVTPRLEVGRGDLRNLRRNQEPAVIGQSGQNRIDVSAGARAARGDELHRILVSVGVRQRYGITAFPAESRASRDSRPRTPINATEGRGGRTGREGSAGRPRSMCAGVPNRIAVLVRS